MAENHEPVLEELRKITKLLAIGLLEGKQRDKIEKLAGARFSPKDIADALGISPNVVSAEKSKLKKKAKSARKRHASED